MTDYVLPWHQDDHGAQRQQRRRNAPGLWAQHLVPGEPPNMPPGFAGAFSCCRNCPWEVCEVCPPNRAWIAFHNQQIDELTPPRRSWWARLTGRTPQEDT